MKTKFPLNYLTIERIKAEEYELFFHSLKDYDLYLNHLGEIRWMTSSEARGQHEFFIYERNRIQQFKKKWRLRHPAKLNRVSPPERELRLQIRKYLEEKYLGQLREETRSQIPETWHYEFSTEDIESIPIALSFYQTGFTPKSVLAALVIFFIFILAVSFLIHSIGDNNGRVLVKSNVTSGRVYMDGDQFLGYTGKVISRIPPGIHRFLVRKHGYQALPAVKSVTIRTDSLTEIYFDLKPTAAEVTGYLRVGAEEPHSQLFVDNRNFGEIINEMVIPLKEGNHKVSIRKRGFLSIPGERIIRITPGDTSLFVVEQTLISSRGRSSSNAPRPRGVGSLSVNTNVPGARIFLDGRDTGKETDYVFPRLSFGSHEIWVLKDGYTSSPQIRTITLSRQKPNLETNFHLSKNFSKVSISLSPQNAPLFIDGKSVGSGSYEGNLSMGTHTLSFGSLTGYKTPRPRKIQVTGKDPLQLKINYFPDVHIRAVVGNTGNLQIENCVLRTGFNFSQGGFSPSHERGPTVVFNEAIQNYAWKLGFAFPYKNPHGNHALLLTFKLPNNLSSQQKFNLTISAASSRQKYPFALSDNVKIKVKLNGTVLNYFYPSKYIEESHQLDTQTWDITGAVKPGRNTLEISTTDKNRNYYFIKKIEIHN